MVLIVQLLGCAWCRGLAPAPILDAPDVLQTAEGETLVVDLSPWVESHAAEDLFWEIQEGPGFVADISGETLRIVPDLGFEGETQITLFVSEGEPGQADQCADLAEVTVPIMVGTSGPEVDCRSTFIYQAQGDPDTVALAGSFNGWDVSADALIQQTDGSWSLDLELPPGAYEYKFVELSYGDGGRTEDWVCDPLSAAQQCDEGYSWNPSCTLGQESCNSLLIVPECSLPTSELSVLNIDREGGRVDVELVASPGEGAGEIAEVVATLDGAEVYRGELTPLTFSELEPGRHTLRIDVWDDAGAQAEQLYVPFWSDEGSWERGLMYYVFVDRFNDGDLSLNTQEGASHALTDYLGGDWQGVIDKLDYLDELGVTVIWLTAPQDNGEGAWGDSCGENYSGYHGYWPSEAFQPEEHFGTDAELRALIDGAHARGMRVLTDWVANHVHQDHPYYQDNPEWFNEQLICQGDVWNTDPETCWFDSFLPDFRYYDTEPLQVSVDDAMWWVKEYELDGYRVDAVKHMPHSLFFNFQSRVHSEIEHRHAGGDEDFYTVGETFSGDRGLIKEYVNEQELDAQFDFTLYWSILSAIGRNESSLMDLERTFEGSEEAYRGYLMSTFLGNHDVERFIAHSAGEVNSLYGDGACPDGPIRGPDDSPEWDEPYLRLQLAWTYLLTHEGLPLVYYGDEIGLSGYHDPDNRQMMVWEDEWSWREQQVHEHVSTLGQARKQHPSMAIGERTIWWEEADVLAWARVHQDDEMLAILNRSWSDRTLDNSLSFAGLTPGATYVDLLSGDRFTANGDSISIWMPGMSSRVLVLE